MSHLGINSNPLKLSSSYVVPTKEKKGVIKRFLKKIAVLTRRKKEDSKKPVIEKILKKQKIKEELEIIKEQQTILQIIKEEQEILEAKKIILTVEAKTINKQTQDNEDDIIKLVNSSITQLDDKIKWMFQPILSLLENKITKIPEMTENYKTVGSPEITKIPEMTENSKTVGSSEITKKVKTLKKDQDKLKNKITKEQEIEKCYNKYIITLTECITEQENYSIDKNIRIELNKGLNIIYSYWIIKVKRNIDLTNFNSFINSITTLLIQSSDLIKETSNNLSLSQDKKELINDISKKINIYLDYYNKNRKLIEDNSITLLTAKELLSKLQSIILIIITEEVKRKCKVFIATPNKGGRNRKE
tara:strand:- start:978 stop:2057 length:1080 start_codon:yes stop_codon:yes gene_type:complete